MTAHSNISVTVHLHGNQLTADESRLLDATTRLWTHEPEQPAQPDDLDRAAAPNPGKAREWLERHGWEQTRRLGDIAAVFRRGQRDVLVPLAPDSPDFHLRWTEMLNKLAEPAERETLDLAARRVADQHLIATTHNQIVTADFQATISCTCGHREPSISCSAGKAIELARRATIAHYLDAYLQGPRP